jgi:hypothetical protein
MTQTLYVHKNKIKTKKKKEKKGQNMLAKKILLQTSFMNWLVFLRKNKEQKYLEKNSPNIEILGLVYKYKQQR